jgi:hypothetical protein
MWFYYSVIAATYLRSSLSSLLVSFGISLIPVTVLYLLAAGQLRLTLPPPVADQL